MDPMYGPHLPQQQQQQQPNPFQAASDPGSPTGVQMLEVLGQMVQQSQEQVRTLGQQSQEQLRVLGRTLETVTAKAGDRGDANAWSRLLPRPDIFKPQTRDEEISGFPEWSWQFKQYIRAIDGEMCNMLEEVENDLQTEVFLGNMTPDAQNQAKKLFALLTTLLRERPLQLLRSAEQGNGFEAWRLLTTTLAPASKSRSLALLGAITQFPAMSNANVLEQLLRLEELFRKYAQAAGSDVPSDLKSALLLRSLPQSVKTHVSMTCSETSTYEVLRETVVRWERNTQKWNHTLVSHTPSTPSIDTSAPMDVDRIQKGKGKDKGKGYGNQTNGKGDKGKFGGKYGKAHGHQQGKGGWSGKGGWVQGGHWSNNGKGKGYGGKSYDFKGEKGKWSSKGDSKGQSKGKGKYKNDNNCRICGKPGHWGNECWMNKGSVKHVSEEPSSSTSSNASTAPISASVKRVFNLASDDHVPETVIYTIAEGHSDRESVDSWWCRVVQCVDLFEQDDDEVIDYDCASYTVYDMTTTDAYPEDFDWVVRGVHGHIPEAPVLWERDPNVCEVVLDSGADVSVMPVAWLDHGFGSVAHGQVRMQDAQGNSMPCQGSRLITLDLGPICVQEQFYASAVSTPLMSLGRLLRQGWSVEQRHGNLCLCNVPEEVEIPISFKRNSLVVQASVHMVQTSDEAVKPVVSHPGGANRVVVEVNFPFDHVDGQWGFLACGDPAFMTTGRTFIDPSPKMGIHLWKYRTTLIQIGEQWEMCDFQEPLEHCASLEEPLPGVIMPVSVLTIMHRAERTLEQCGIGVLSEFKFEDPKLPEVPEIPEVIDIPMEEREDPPPPQPPAAPPGVMLQGGGDDHVVVEGIRLGPESNAAALKAACRSLGIGSSGSKAHLFKRLLNHMKRRQFEDALALEQAAKPLEHEPRAQSTPHTPTEEEIALHNLTHVPYKSWCPQCISSRSRRDRHDQGGENHASPGGFPCISFDFWYTKISGKEYHFMERAPENDKEVLTMLSVVDRSTGMIRGVSLPSKGQESLVHAAKEILSFIAYLGYQTVEVRADNEPAMESLVTMVVQARSKIGLRTICKPSQPYEHATNGAAEQAIQTLRDLGTTLLEQVKAKAGIELKTSDDLVGWSYSHAAHLHNCFSVAGGTTPFERAFGVKYQGKLAMFGETVYFALSAPHTKKGKPKFARGLFLGKTAANDLNICGTALGIYLSSTIRRLPIGQQWCKQVLKEFQGKAYKYGMGNLGGRLVPGLKVRQPDPIPDASIPVLAGPHSEPVNNNDEAASDPPSTPGSHSHGQPGGDSLASYAPSSNKSEHGLLPEAPMETSSPVPKRGEAPTGPDAESSEPPSKHPRTIQTVKVNGDYLYTLDEPWEMHVGEGDEHMEAFWDESDDELDWSGLQESDGPPDLLEDQLKLVDFSAESEEVDRLETMKVLESVSNLPQRAKLLHTRFVHDWRFRDKTWKRRARLVCKELKIWDPNRSDVYAPSTNPAVCRVIPLLFVSKPGWIMKAFDIKDAFLCVPQREELYVTLGGRTYQVHYCLPGQQAASAWWGEQLAGDLKTAGLSVDIACPAVLGQESTGATVHVDDGLLGGDSENVDAVVKVLETRYKVQVSDPVCKPGDSLRFLKKELVVTEDGVTINLDPKYLDRVCEILGIVNPKRRRVPCSQDILASDESAELPAAQASKYRAAIGSLLYISPERPDCQFCIACLARYMSRPTVRSWNHLRHLSEYLVSTKEYSLCLRWSFPGRSTLDERSMTWDEVRQRQLETRMSQCWLSALQTQTGQAR